MLMAAPAVAQQPPNCPLGGAVVAADNSAWVCRGTALAPLQVSTGGGSAAWGDITGTLANQTDLDTALGGKQATLVSGTNIKTVNGTSLLGSGDVSISGTAAWGSVTGTLSNQTDLQTALDGKLGTSGNGSSLTGLTKSQVGLANVDNTADANKSVSSAATLTTPRTINGVSFNGSANITVTAAGSTLSDAVPINRGGTGVAALGTANQVLRTNGAANGTEWATIAGGSVPSYTLHVQALTSSPADGATIYFGQLPKAPVTAQGTSRIYIRKAGTIKIANIFSFSGTAGTNENWTCNIRLNNTGDTAIATVSAATSERVWSNSGLSLAVTTSDYIEIKCVNPTWVTNPLTTIFGGYLVIEY